MGITFGAAFGAVLGVFTDNLPICVAIGTSLGLVVGIMLDAAKAKDKKPEA